MANDDKENSPPPERHKRERSTRYPGVGLPESLKLCASVEELGVDGLSAAGIASALGFTNIKTNTFSARLSAARQFGLLTLAGNGYALTPLAREILHPPNPDDLPRLLRHALLKPPLYADLAQRLGGKKLPDPAILGNILYHHHQIIASAKDSAVDAFLNSARYAGTLGEDNIFQPDGPPSANTSAPTPRSERSAATPSPTPRASDLAPKQTTAEVRLDLQLWDADEGKTIRLRAPRTITPASYERFLQSFRLVVRVADPNPEDVIH